MQGNEKPKEAVLSEVLAVRPKKGEIGIEIELEGLGLRHIQMDNFWNIEHDGSLRGEAIELVLKTPAPRHLVPARLLQFQRLIEGCKIFDTGRAGIHIHVNVQNLTPREYVQFLCMYLIFEDILVDFCGEGRVGNLFCLRTSDASGGLKEIRHYIQSWSLHRLGTDRIRYASMNLKATATYGSLEFRAMRSTTEVPVIQKWIDILCSLKDQSRMYESPAQVVEQLSILGTEEFFQKVLGKFELPYNHRSMMEGVRNAQLLAYCREDFFVEAKKKEIPGKLRLDEQRNEVNPEGDIPEELNIPKLRIPPEWINVDVPIGAPERPLDLRGMGQGIGPLVAPAFDEEVRNARLAQQAQAAHHLERLRILEDIVRNREPEEEEQDDD